jgi:hypothetical protein
MGIFLQTVEATHKFEDLGSHHRIWLNSIAPSTPQPYQASSDFCLCGVVKDTFCSVKFEAMTVIDAMRIWLCEQDRAWYRQEMHVLILLWCKAMKVDGFFMEKQGIYQKPSVLTMCNFHDSEINVD